MQLPLAALRGNDAEVGGVSHCGAGAVPDRVVKCVEHFELEPGLERLANRIWILKSGRLIWNGDLDALKESMIRVHLPKPAADAARTRLRQTISVRDTESAGCRIVALRAPDEDWSALEDLLGAEARIEHMNLEDIFVELHP